MKALKSVLEEELQTSLRQQAEHEKAIAALPRGALVRKFVKGYQYYYLRMRKGNKVHYEYKGKLLAREIRQYDGVRKDRARHRKLLGNVKKRIAFIRRMLRSREMKTS